MPWILVSHDMGTIRNQTSRVLVLEGGRCRFAGDPEEAISHYRLTLADAQQEQTRDPAHGSELEPERGPARLRGVTLCGADGEPSAHFETGQALDVRIDFDCAELVKQPALGIAFYGADGTCYTGTNTRTSGFAIDHLCGRGRLHFRIPHLPFLPGLYRIRVDLHDRHMGVLDSLPAAAHLRVVGGAFAAGLFAPEHGWALAHDDAESVA